MIIIIALKHAALGFCLCQEEFTHAGMTCDCAESVAVESTCGCCPTEQGAVGAPPCDDCVVEVSVDPGEFLWSAQTFEPSDEIGSALTVPTAIENLRSRALATGPSFAPLRGSPPGGPPLFLRTRVLRL